VPLADQDRKPTDVLQNTVRRHVQLVTSAAVLAEDVAGLGLVLYKIVLGFVLCEIGLRQASFGLVASFVLVL
jgi:hypothetical protein